MQMSNLYASDFPFKNFYKVAKQGETKGNYQKQGLVVIWNSQISSIPSEEFSY